MLFLWPQIRIYVGLSPSFFSNRASTLSSSFSWFVSVPLVIIIISSKKACAELMFASVKFIIFWNVAGISVSP